MRFVIHLRYLGKHYHGWQRQLQVPTVQAALESALSTLLQASITCHGCGRTDAGVHASQYFAQFDVDTKWEIDLLHRINRLLPSDITVFQIFAVHPIFNVQRYAIERTYRYFFHQYPSPFLTDVSTFIEAPPVDLQKMLLTMKEFKGKHDFTAFCLQPNGHKSTICSVQNVELVQHKLAGQFYISITADRFLRGMMRFIVMAIIEVGWCKRSLEEVRDALHRQVPLNLRRMAYPQGLHLARVKYATLDVEPSVVRLGTGKRAWLMDGHT